MNIDALAVAFCGFCGLVCLVTTAINVKLFTEWVKHGILKK
jgi:hypothetical protein